MIEILVLLFVCSFLLGCMTFRRFSKSVREIERLQKTLHAAFDDAAQYSAEADMYRNRALKAESKLLEINSLIGRE